MRAFSCAEGALDAIREFSAQILTGVGALFWTVRIEGAVRANDREIRPLQHQRNEDQATHKEARQATDAMLTEVRADIKELWRRNPKG